MLNDEGIIWKTRFTNILCLKSRLWPNDVDLTLHMTPQTSQAGAQNVAFEKIKYISQKILQNAIFINHDKTHWEKLSEYGNRVIDFTNVPVDQIVGISLFYKFNAVAGDQMKVNFIEIESWQGENLKFIISNDSPEKEIIKQSKIKNPWWFDSSPRFTNFTKKVLTWQDIGFTISDTDEKFKIIQGGK